MAAEGAGIRFGQYVLLRRLARGGMAEVFLAQQRGLEGFDRRVAVKRILPHLADAPDFIKMFLSEAKLAAQLTHPNIVHIYDFGKVDGDYFIAMEFVDGVHAGELFKHAAAATKGGDRLSPTMIARVGADAAAALHYAHELRAANGKPYGLVHRDVSPANLMATFDGAIKLCDFGIAKAAALGDQLTIPGHVKGKYAYMSPEQTTGAPLDGRSDVYSLAIVLWELVVGKTIVPRGDAIEAMRAIRDGKLMPVDRAAPWTPPPLAHAITWALQTSRDRRPTAMQLAEALEAFIKSSPELATPLQLGAWLRARFPREREDDSELSSSYPSADGGSADGEPGTQASNSTLPGTGSNDAQPAAVAGNLRRDSASALGSGALGSGALGSGSLGSIDSVGSDSSASISDTDSETHALVLPPARPSRPPSEDLADAATVLAGDRMIVDPHDTIAQDNDETVMRGASFRAPGAEHPRAPSVASDGFGARTKSPTSPPNAHTLYDPRANTAANAGGSPIFAPGQPGLPGQPILPGPPIPTGPIAKTLYDARGGGPGAKAGAAHSAPTIIDSRASLLRPSPLIGMPVMPGTAGGPAQRAATQHVGGRQIPPRLLAIGTLVGIAVLSFIIALAARGRPVAKTDGGSGSAGSGSGSGSAAVAIAPRPAPVDAAVPDAAPPPPPPVDAAPQPPPPIDAGLAPTIPPDAAASTVLEVRTRPDGGSITINGEARTSPAQFTLAPGHYAIDAEHDGWLPEHRELDLAANSRVVQDIVFSHERTRPHGRLNVHTTPPCEVYLGTRRLTSTPINDLELEPGTYTLLFKHPQHTTVIKTVTITAGKTTRLAFTLP